MDVKIYIAPRFMASVSTLVLRRSTAEYPSALATTVATIFVVKT